MNAVLRKKGEGRPRHSVIIGLGRTGLACARYLSAQGGSVAVTDSREHPPGLDQLGALKDHIELRLGRFDASLLEDASQLVVSPGVSLAEPIVREARARGIEVVGDIELFARAVRAPVVAVTGTNGKSTVTTLIALMIEASGRRALAGGNLGTPALDLLAADAPDFYVLELSSFQLETTSSLALEAAAVLNVTPDHMDRYASTADYAGAKARIFTHTATAIVNLDDPLVRKMPRPGQKTLGFSIAGAKGSDFGLLREPGSNNTWLARGREALLELSAMKLSGLHNAANALAALAVCEAIGIPRAPAVGVLRAFVGLPHRMQWVAERRGVRWIDDSKGTNVGSTLAAVNGMPGPLLIIAGGDGKNQDFSALAPAFRGKVRHAVLLGKDAGAIAQVLDGVCAIERVRSMEEAVAAAARAARPGDTVLLSPACSSLDMFRDYAQRGDLFAAAVQALTP